MLYLRCFKGNTITWYHVLTIQNLYTVIKPLVRIVRKYSSPICVGKTLQNNVTHLSKLNMLTVSQISRVRERFSRVFTVDGGGYGGTEIVQIGSRVS